jgi:hypothetical protein
MRRKQRFGALIHPTYSSLPNVTTLSKFGPVPPRTVKRSDRPSSLELKNKRMGHVPEKEKGPAVSPIPDFFKPFGVRLIQRPPRVAEPK